jgi:hypothetical protein
VLLTNTDLPVITVAELNRAYEDLVAKLADYNGVYGDCLHARLAAMVDEIHGRALAENIRREQEPDRRNFITRHTIEQLNGFEEEERELVESDTLRGVARERAAWRRQLVLDELHGRALTEYLWQQDGVTDEIPASHTCDGCRESNCYQRYRQIATEHGETPLRYDEWVSQVSDYERD